MSAEDPIMQQGVPDEQPAGVIISREDWQQIQSSMATYKDIELKYIASRSQAGLPRRVLAAFILADCLLYFGLWLGFTGWQEAGAWAIMAFAAQEMLLALVTFLGATLRAR